MATIPTKNTVPSESYNDLRFNSGKLDEFVTSSADTYTDRLGVAHLTARGLQNSVAGALLPQNNLADVQDPNESLSNLGGTTSGIAVFKAGSAQAARSAISAAASGNNTDITQLSGITTALTIDQGGTGAKTASTARASLQAASSGANNDITSINGLTTALSVSQGGTGGTTQSGARTSLGLGTLSTQNSSSVTISGGTISGINDLAVSDGGTGASSPATARSNLGAKADAGVTDASSASAGQVGEVLTVTTNATANTSSTPVNAAQLALTAGDWEISGVIRLNSSSAPYTVFVAGFNTTSAAQPSFPNAVQLNIPTSSTTQQASVPMMRLNVNATTTIYLVALAIFASGTSTVDGYIRARRVR